MPKGGVFIDVVGEVGFGGFFGGEGGSGKIGAMDEAESFGLSVDFLAGHGCFKSVLGGRDSLIHEGDGTDGTEAEDGDGEHDFDKCVAAEEFISEILRHG